MKPLLVRAATPAARLVACVLLVAAAATAPLRAPCIFVALLAALLVLAAARPRFERLVPTFSATALAVLALLVPFILAGRAHHAAWLGARALSAVLLALAFASTLGVNELGGALSALRFPSALTTVVASMLRQLAAVRGQGKTLLLARGLRGAHGIGVGAEVLASLFVRTSERAERAELAARLRGFDLASERKRAALRLSDLPLLTCAAAVAAAVHLAARLA